MSWAGPEASPDVGRIAINRPHLSNSCVVKSLHSHSKLRILADFNVIIGCITIVYSGVLSSSALPSLCPDHEEGESCMLEEAFNICICQSISFISEQVKKALVIEIYSVIIFGFVNFVKFQYLKEESEL